MNFWNFFFGKEEEDKAKKDNQSPFMPEKKEPIEIEFANNFTKKGGRFLFADSKLDCNSFFRKILNENNWNKSDIFFLDKKIAKEFYLDSNELIEKKEKKVAFIGCEFLIANTGGILISSNQVENLNLAHLPDNIIVKASMNQFASDISDGMSKLKTQYEKDLPINISNLNAKNPEKESDFLSHGNSSKNIYLLIN